MSIVGAFDVHRRQVTFDYADTVTGEVKRGRVVPADREHLREWLGLRFAGQDDVHFALEGCTGWRYVVEELLAAGIEPHLAEPAGTAALRGRKRHAKTDKTDSRHLRVHLAAGGPARMLDSAGPRAGGARRCPALQGPARRARRVASADRGNVVPPGRPGGRFDGRA
jgi:hypothetical protein